MRATSRAALLWHDTAGSNMVEFAICALAVMLCILGVMEGSRALYVEHAISSMSRDAARYAMVRGASWSGTACASTTTFSCEASITDVSTYIKTNIPPGISATSLTIATTWPGTTGAGTACDTTDGTNSAGCTVKVTLTYPFTFLLPAPASTSISFRSNAVMTITQ